MDEKKREPKETGMTNINQELLEKLNQIRQQIQDELPDDIGFCLIVMPTTPPALGTVHIAANDSREVLQISLDAFIKLKEQGPSSSTGEQNG